MKRQGFPAEILKKAGIPDAPRYGVFHTGWIDEIPKLSVRVAQIVEISFHRDGTVIIEEATIRDGVTPDRFLKIFRFSSAKDAEDFANSEMEKKREEAAFSAFIESKRGDLFAQFQNEQN